MASFEPDVIIAFGGGSPMDAAKIMWLMYEHPDVNFERHGHDLYGYSKESIHIP